MRRHFLFAEDEEERSVGEGKENLLRLWHNRRNAMLESDESASGGEANALVARELTQLWDLAKPMNSSERDWEYDLEGVGSIGEFTKTSSSFDNEVISQRLFYQWRVASVFSTFFKELRNSVAEPVVSYSSSKPEQDETKLNDPVDRFTLRPLSRIPKIANDAFLQKLPPSSDTMRNIRGLQPPDQPDDVHPSELSASDDQDHSITVDYLVALTALPSELEFQLKGSELAPVAGRLYSVRELATLRTTSSDELAAKGFADFLLPPKKLEVEAEALQEPIAVVENGGGGLNTEDQEGEAPPEENDQEETEDSGLVPPYEPVLPPEPTPAERSEIEPPNEPTLPFGSLSLLRFIKGYHEYVTRMQHELSTRRALDVAGNQSSCHFVVVLATQPLNVIRDHCIQAITSASIGLSRSSTSREACPISVPEDLNGSSRSEKVKWLLYGDWSTLVEADTSESFARLPRRDAKRRLLSKWREFCPVLSTSTNTLRLGEPEFAACYSGRVYFLASQDARRDFCAHPLQYLRRDIRFHPREVLTPSYLETLETGLHMQTVSPSKLLKTSSISLEMRLMSGQIVSPIEAATVAAEAVKVLQAKSTTATGWMITDLPLTRDVAAVLLEHGCVPDVILLMDREVAAQEEEEGKSLEVVDALSALRRQQFQAEKAGADDISQGLAIKRELNPIAPRLDSIEDGHTPQLIGEYDPAVIFAQPVPEKDEENQKKKLQKEEESEAEAADPETEKQAEAARNRALQLQGECGRFCPVSWRTRGLLIPGLPSSICSFRQKFYAFSGESERRAFERNPGAFIPEGPCATANFVPCVLLLGVRGSGRGRIAQHYLSHEWNKSIPLQKKKKVLDARTIRRGPEISGEAIVDSSSRYQSMRPTLFERCDVLDMTAGGKMHQMLASGELLVGKHGLACPVTGRTDSLSATSVKAVAYRDQLYFPRSREARRALCLLSNSNETETLSQSLQPDMLFVLERRFASVWKEQQANVERSDLQTAFARWHHYRLELIDVWTRRFGIFHVRQLDSSSSSLWNVAAQAQDSSPSSSKLQARQHPIFQTFCPVELRVGRFYNSRQSNRDLCVDFRGFSFWLGNEQNLQQFAASPEAFVGYLVDQTPDESWPTQEEAESEAQTLVARSPVNASLVSLLTVPDCDFPELKGYCPVTFASGSGAKDWTALRHGNVFFRASYRSKVYFFVSEEARRKFCAEPSRYTSQSLPVKLPPQVTLAKSYPGQLEQQLGDALNEVLLALGSERPKFPQMSMRASACVYLALSLKALQRRYQLKMKPDPRSARDEDEPGEEQKQRQQQREEQVEQEALAKRDAFVGDCRLGDKLKTASTPAHPSCGSGAMVARNMRAAQDSLADNEAESSELAVSTNEDVELLRHRFDVIVSGSTGDDKPLSVDPDIVRMHARAAFLEYTKASTSS
ncbi:Protein of unknown function DUF3508 [Phytophthora cactorum]|nr:Protein of unknown function DUF3508 [Phytophthora cactorum]